MSLFQDVQNGLGGSIGKALGGIAPGAASSIAQSMVGRYVPHEIQRGISTGLGVLGDLENGNVIGAISRVLPDVTNGLLSQAAYWGTPTPLFGGISPFEAKQIYDEMQSTRFCKKNLFLIEVQSNLYGDDSYRFNLFCTSLEYEPFTISGEKHKIGAAHADSVNSGDPVTLSLVTKDSEDGFLRRWFEGLANTAVSKDGTVGVPNEYAIRIAIVHGFITQESNRGGYENIGWFRPANLGVSLSRSEQALAEFPMTFEQMDTFQL